MDDDERTPVDEAFCLECGGSWFELVGEDIEAEGLGAVTLDGTGRIRVVDGSYICYDCGEPAVFPQMSGIPEQLSAAQLDDLALILPPLVTIGTQEQSDRKSAGLPAAEKKQDLQKIDPSRAAPD